MSQRKPDTRKRPEPTPFKSKAQKKYKAQRRRMMSILQSRDIKTWLPAHHTTTRPSVQAQIVCALRFLRLIQRSFQINDELEPRIWKDDKLRPFVGKKLMEIANDFIDGLPFNVNVKDIRFTGSLANYHWSKYSDIDLHIVVDFAELDDNKELVKEMFDAKRLRWNENHNITLKGYEVELYIEDEGEQHSSSGIYSVMNDEWINKPERLDTSIDLDTAKKKASDIERQIGSIDSMFDRGQFEKVIRHVDRLKKRYAP